MNNERAREIFNDVISKTNDVDEITRLELMREYFTNGEFREALQERLWLDFNARQYNRDNVEP